MSGAVGYLYSGWGVTGLPAGSLGFIYLPAMLALMLMTVLMAPLGARAAHAAGGSFEAGVRRLDGDDGE